MFLAPLNNSVACHLSSTVDKPITAAVLLTWKENFQKLPFSSNSDHFMILSHVTMTQFSFGRGRANLVRNLNP